MLKAERERNAMEQKQSLTLEDKDTLVIYHSEDIDGILSANTLYEWLREFPLSSKEIHFLGYNYGAFSAQDWLYKMPKLNTVYMLDVAIPVPDVKVFLQKDISVVYIDHHVTSINEYKKANLSAVGRFLSYSQSGIADWSAALLTKQFTSTSDFKNFFPAIPPLYLLVSIYDTWQTNHPAWNAAEALNCYLMSQNLRYDDPLWGTLKEDTKEAIEKGTELLQIERNRFTKDGKRYGGTLKWKGITFFAMNGSGNSKCVGNNLVKGLHEAILLYRFWPAENSWKISLYNATEYTGVTINLAPIATMYGGGGHAGACGFTCKELPFNLSEIKPLE